MKLTIYLLFLLVACSSPKKRGTPKNVTFGADVSRLKITAIKDEIISHEGHYFINLYFRNEGKDWLKVKRAEITSVKGSPNFKIIDEDDISDLLEDVKNKMVIGDNRKKATKEERVLFHLKSYDVEKYLPEPFTLPGQLQLDRWIVFKIPKGEKLKKFTLEVELTDSKVQVYDIRPGLQY